MISQPLSYSSNIHYSRAVHLSHLIDTDIPRWIGDPPVEFTSVAELKNDGYYLRRFSLGEHSATHINAPNSFYADCASVDQYPAASLILPAIVSGGLPVNEDFIIEKIRFRERIFTVGC